MRRFSCFASGVSSTGTVTIYDVSADSLTPYHYNTPSTQTAVRQQDLLKLASEDGRDMQALARIGDKWSRPTEFYVMDEDATANPKTRDLIFIVAKRTGKKLRWHECGS
eukprot:GHVU01220453.1.p2 GENE.GHVU01220453.1~~GHVU01220453.1.p2  ORF type:complete len:109 (+),score=7.81 GHVU01220453.1:284-610(+)